MGIDPNRAQRVRRAQVMGGILGGGVGAPIGIVLFAVLVSSPVADLLRQHGFTYFSQCLVPTNLFVALISCGLPEALVAGLMALIGSAIGSRIAVHRTRRP